MFSQLAGAWSKQFIRLLPYYQSDKKKGNSTSNAVVFRTDVEARVRYGVTRLMFIEYGALW